MRHVPVNRPMLLPYDSYSPQDLITGTMSTTRPFISRLPALGLEVTQQPGEGRLEGRWILPVGKVAGDIIRSDLPCQVFARIGVETLPGLDRSEVHQPQREQYAALFPLLAGQGRAQFEFHPWAVH